jgi:DNA-binding response OmpR family regulator
MIRPTILLAEDDPIIAMDLCWYLESRQLQVIPVNNLEGLLDYCRQNKPKGVILNVMSSKGWNGWAIGQQLQEWGISVFFITGAFITGADLPQQKTNPFPVLYKPFSRSQLSLCLDEWLH